MQHLDAAATLLHLLNSGIMCIENLRFFLYITVGDERYTAMWLIED